MLSKRLKRLVKEYALRSLYKLNAQSADCYAFDIVRCKDKPLDWQGGWDWSKRLVVDSQYLYMLESNKFIKRY